MGISFKFFFYSKFVPRAVASLLEVLESKNFGRRLWISFLVAILIIIDSAPESINNFFLVVDKFCFLSSLKAVRCSIFF